MAAAMCRWGLGRGGVRATRALRRCGAAALRRSAPRCGGSSCGRLRARPRTRRSTQLTRTRPLSGAAMRAQRAGPRGAAAAALACSALLVTWCSARVVLAQTQTFTAGYPSLSSITASGFTLEVEANEAGSAKVRVLTQAVTARRLACVTCAPAVAARLAVGPHAPACARPRAVRPLQRASTLHMPPPPRLPDRIRIPTCQTFAAHDDGPRAHLRTRDR